MHHPLSDLLEHVAKDLECQKRDRIALQNQWDLLLELIETRTFQLWGTEQSLKESREFLDKIINSLADPLFVKDSNLSYHLVNDAACSLMGKDRHEIIGTTDQTMLPRGQASFIHQRDLELLRTGISCSYNLDKPFPDGTTRTLQIRKTRYINPYGEGYIVGVIRDITDQVTAQQQQSRYAQYLCGALEDERCRIARELHDLLGHALTEQSFKLRDLQRTMALQHTPVPQHLDELLHGVDTMVHIVQRLCTGLRPSLLDELGLAAAVEWLAEETTRNTGIDCRVFWSDDGSCTPDHEIELFRIVQESLNNVMKHAGAEQVTIRFRRIDAGLSLEINDNGRGFDLMSDKPRRSFGIIGMRERASALGGDLEIVSTPDRGTTVRLVIPLPGEPQP